MWFLASAGDPSSHVKDVVNLWGTPLTQHTITVTVVAIVFVLVMMKVAKAIATGDASEGNDRYLTRGKLAQFVEVIVLYLRDVILRPLMGDEAARRHLPFLLTLFFFVLFNNLFGLIPIGSIFEIVNGVGGTEEHPVVVAPFIGGTATASITVTAALALIAFVVIEAHGIRELGVKGWFLHNFGGLVPGPILLFPIALIVLVVELMGHLIKPAALAIRLFANMVAGHTLMAVLLSLGAMFAKHGLGVASGVTVVGGLAAVAITFLELFVAFLQAFVFMFLTSVFISLLSHHDDHGHEEHAEGVPAAAH